MHVLPLYSLLPNEQQMLVFRPPPTGSRLVIIATNVAETSLTIPGIRYVVDSGRAKERQYNSINGVQSFAVSWISKASAAQRAGRAGRTGPGHCYRLYSSALYEDHFPQFSTPEIVRMPIEGVVLQMKAMNVDAVVNFPFPTPPDRLALSKAEKLLTHLGALDPPSSTRMIGGQQIAGAAGGRINDLGKRMAAYPVSPRFAKMLSIGDQHECLSYVIAIVATLSVGDPFVHEQSIEAASDDEDGLQHLTSADVRTKEARKELRRRYFTAHAAFELGGGSSDLFKSLAAVGGYEHDPTPSFCERNFLRPKAMVEIAQLRSQLHALTSNHKTSVPRLTPPTSTQLKVLRQIITAAFIDQIARRDGPVATSSRNVPYRAHGVTEPIYIHSSSTLFHRPPPEWIVYTEMTKTSRVYVKGVSLVNPAWLAALGKGLCAFSKADAGGRVVGDEREVVVVPHFGDLGDLPPVKRKQRREGTRWVMVD